MEANIRLCSGGIVHIIVWRNGHIHTSNIANKLVGLVFLLWLKESSSRGWKISEEQARLNLYVLDVSAVQELSGG